MVTYKTISSLTAKADPTTSDLLVIADVADSNNMKKITVGSIITDIGSGLINDTTPSTTTTYSSTKINTQITAATLDASTTVKGKTKLSVAPASATEPIAVGSNDPKVPPVSTATMTVGQVEAMIGTSGTPSSTNKYVTNDDTTATPTASKVVRYDGSGNLPGSKALTDISQVSGEAITAGQAVFIESVTAQTGALNYLQQIGDVTANTRVSFPIFGTGVAGTTVSTNITKFGSPSVAIGYRIETDNAGSPSGTAVTNGTGTITAASLTSYSLVTATGATITSFAGTITASVGYKITTNAFRQVMTSVTKFASSSATRCTLRDSSHNILDSATYSGNVATFSGTYALTASTTYYIENDANGGSYNSYVSSSVAFPYNGTNINITAGWNSGADSPTQAFEIASINTTRVDITNSAVTLSGSVTLTAGTRYHLVIFQGTSGSETVNASNYYKIGYGLVNTTTRPSKTWNGSAWSAVLATTFCYTSSTLFLDSVLSLTDADFSYKVNMYGLSSETKAVGLYPNINIAGINANQTGLTINILYYLSGTPGAISTTAGTNEKKVGTSTSSTVILLGSSAILGTATTSYVASTNYLAATDGFVVVYGSHSSSQLNFDIKSDVTTTPTTIVARYGVANGSAIYGSLTYPVKKGNYWSTTFTTGTPTLISFIPLS